MILSCRQVTKTFGAFKAVNGVSFDIAAGRCIGLLGPNGAGKSTLIKTFYGAIPYDGGEVRVFDLDPMFQSREIKKRVGVVLQENCLDESLSVWENLSIHSRFLGMSRSSSEQKILQLLKFMALDHKAEAKIKTLSGGMQRRMTFVRALLNEPRFLILDEPTTGLDPAVRRLLWQKVNELKASGVTILVTTHYMDEAEQLCDEVVIMDQGRVAEIGSPKELVKKFASTPKGEGRTGNLEDVFIAITGKELSSDA